MTDSTQKAYSHALNNPFAEEEDIGLLSAATTTAAAAYPDSSRHFFSVRSLKAIIPCFAMFVIACIMFIVVLVDTNVIISSSKSILISATNGAVAAENKLCSQIGLEVLKEGGSAVDAVIAATICCGCLNSFSSGIGGGGFMLIRSKNGSSELVDFREAAPMAATEDMFKKDPRKATFGGLAVAVPGELRGLELAHKRFAFLVKRMINVGRGVRYGKLPWKRLFEPSIQLAEQGFEVTPLLETRLLTVKEKVLENEEFKRIFAPNGKLLRKGDICYRKHYASTLRKVAEGGADAFYQGDIAADIVQSVNQQGGILTLDDLKNYTAVLRKPLVGWFHGRKVLTTGPPTSGPILLNIFNILEGFTDWKDKSSPDAVTYQRIIEAFKYGFALRGELGDPTFTNKDNEKAVEEIISKEFAATIRANISDNATFDPKHYNPRYDVKDNHGTMHVSALVPNGEAVSLMSTVNLPFGAFVMGKISGIMLNNEMDDFSTPNTTNSFGLPASLNNLIKPGKRPLSSSVPVIVENNNIVELIAGGSGGTKIITEVILVLLNALENNMRLDEAIDSPRIHHQLFPNTLMLEAGFNKYVTSALTAIGHRVLSAPPELSQGAVQAIRRLKDGTIHAVSDKRKDGEAAGY